MLTEEEMIAKAEKIITSKPFYSYDRSKLIETIKAGVVPEGIVVMSYGDQKVVREGNFAVTYKDKVPIKKVFLNDELFQQLLIGYAIKVSEKGVHVGP